MLGSKSKSHKDRGQTCKISKDGKYQISHEPKNCWNQQFMHIIIARSDILGLKLRSYVANRQRFLRFLFYNKLHKRSRRSNESRKNQLDWSLGLKGRSGGNRGLLFAANYVTHDG